MNLGMKAKDRSAWNWKAVLNEPFYGPMSSHIIFHSGLSKEFPGGILWEGKADGE